MREGCIFQVLDTKVPHDVAAILGSHDQLYVISVSLDNFSRWIN